MTPEEQQQAAAYIKLQDDVKRLIRETVRDELMSMRMGSFGGTLHSVVADITRAEVRTEIQNYRITMRGTSAPY